MLHWLIWELSEKDEHKWSTTASQLSDHFCNLGRRRKSVKHGGESQRLVHVRDFVLTLILDLDF